MIGRHVDLLAVCLLLAGAGVYAGVRQMDLTKVAPCSRAALTQAVERAERYTRSVRVTRAVGTNRCILSHLPSITITSD